jgi:hypothetical protein
MKLHQEHITFGKWLLCYHEGEEVAVELRKLRNEKPQFASFTKDNYSIKPSRMRQTTCNTNRKYDQLSKQCIVDAK